MLSASVTASSMPVSSTGTARVGNARQAEGCMPRRRWASRTRPTIAIVRGAIDRASAAASAGSWKRRGARRTTPNGSVTALKVPKTTSSVARRAPSSAANATLPASTVPKRTSAVRTAIVTSPAIAKTRKDRSLGPGTRCAAYTNHDTATTSPR